MVTGVRPASALGLQATRANLTFRKNRGRIATRASVVVGVASTLHDVLVSWSDDHVGPLAPGASVTLTADSGPSGRAAWTATTGRHVVAAQVDDVDRMPADGTRATTTDERRSQSPRYSLWPD